MKKLNYFEFEYKTNEDEDLLGQKLYSKYTADFESSFNIGNILFNPPQSDGYKADMKLPIQEIIFYDFLVEENSIRLDDFMKSADINTNFGFFVSPKLKDILSKYDLSNHRYYPVNLKFENKLHSYYFLLISAENNGVNYSKSTFIERYNKTNIVPVEKYEDLIEENIAKESGKHYWTVNFEIKEKEIVFDKAPDIYQSLTSTSAFFYFSERLKERLEKEGITGMWLHPYDKTEFYLNDE